MGKQQGSMSHVVPVAEETPQVLRRVGRRQHLLALAGSSRPLLGERPRPIDCLAGKSSLPVRGIFRCWLDAHGLMGSQYSAEIEPSAIVDMRQVNTHQGGTLDARTATMFCHVMHDNGNGLPRVRGHCPSCRKGCPGGRVKLLGSAPWQMLIIFCSIGKDIFAGCLRRLPRRPGWLRGQSKPLNGNRKT